MNLDRNQESIHEVVDAGLLSGAVTMVWQRGEVLQLGEIGYRDVSARTPMLRDTVFRIASMSKPVTTTAAMTLVDEGKLALDDPITRWLPEFADMRVLDDPDGPLSKTPPGPPGDHRRRPADAPQRAGIRVLRHRATVARLPAAALSSASRHLAGGADRAAAGAPAR